MEREKFISAADGTQLYTSTRGAGQPIVLCDGLGCDGFIWRYIKEALAPRYQVVRWNYRGHGLSAIPGSLGSLSIDTFCEDLRAVLDARGLERVVLAGHSLGVQLILEFAHRYPERVALLTTICGSYGTPLRTFHGSGHLGMVFPYVKDLVEQFPERAQWIWSRACGSELAYQFASRVEVNGKLVRRKDFAPYFRHLAGMDVRVFASLLHAASSHTVEDRLPEVKTPALVIGGERDTFTPAWLSERLAELLPDAELLLVRGGSHVAPLEIPELIQLRIERFLEARLPSATASAVLAAPAPRRRRSRATAEA